MKPRCLIWEQDPLQGKRLQQSYAAAGFKSQHLENYHSLRKALKTEAQEPLLLVFGVLNHDPLKHIPSLLSLAPLASVLVLSAQQTLKACLDAYEAGAHCFFNKPVQTEILLAQSWALIQLSHQSLKQAGLKHQSKVLELGAISLYPSSKEVLIQAQRYRLKPREFALLHYLCLHANQRCSREEIIQALWSDKPAPHWRHLDNLIMALRKKLPWGSRLQIETHYGSGYCLALQSES